MRPEIDEATCDVEPAAPLCERRVKHGQSYASEARFAQPAPTWHANLYHES